MFDMTYDNEIARGDDEAGYYENMGWVACREGDRVQFFEFSHCSCYGTFTDVGDDADWEGTLSEARTMAERRLDPDMPDREADPEDFDHKFLVKMYRELLEYLDKEEGSVSS